MTNAGQLRRGDGAEAHRTRDREDDVGSLGEERRRVGLTGGLVSEVPDERSLAVARRERARARRRRPAENLHGLLVSLVVVTHTGHEAVHVEGHRRELLATEGRHRIGLGHTGREDSTKEAGLVGLVLERRDVRAGLHLGRVVHDRELLARVGVGGSGGRRVHQEAHRDDDPATLGDEAVDVGHVVRRGLRREVRERNVAVLLGGVLQASVRRGVEGLVVDATSVGNDAGLELRRGGGRHRCRGHTHCQRAQYQRADPQHRREATNSTHCFSLKRLSTLRKDCPSVKRAFRRSLETLPDICQP